jgi:cytochrome b561
MASSAGTVDHGSSRIGRWLRERRLRIALWIAVLEGVLVALSPGISRWTVIIVAVLAITLYAAAGRTTRWDTGRQISWILAASQSLAVLVTILSFILKWTALVLVVIFAVIALVVLFTDRR